MIIEYRGAVNLKGNLLFFKTVEGTSYGERVVVRCSDRSIDGRVIGLDEDITLIEILGEPYQFDLKEITVSFTGETFKVGVSEDMLGGIFNSRGKPLLNETGIEYEAVLDITGMAYNPYRREYPKDFVHTGISAIDGLNTIVKGQKIPIFSVSGVPTEELVAQIVRQIRVSDESITVFGAIGIKYDTANVLIEGVTSGRGFKRTAVFMSLADESAVNHILLPRVALTFSEFMAFEKGYDVVVILYDMTNYGDSLRELSIKREEIPSRRGYPGYLYSDLASIYERSGIIKGKRGSITQIPILTLPEDDITHPIPDLTGYITEGQIVLDRTLYKSGVYPPVNILPSLSRLMNRGISKLHQRWANQIYSAYSKGKKAEMIASIIGESEIGDIERKYLHFSREFERRFLNQDRFEDRELETTLDIGWELLKILPVSELTRLKDEDIKEYILGKGKEQDEPPST